MAPKLSAYVPPSDQSGGGNADKFFYANEKEGLL